jgi:hypothetical protein
MRTVERAARVGVGAWNDSGVTVARESAMADLEKGDERINYRRFALCWQACATFQLAQVPTFAELSRRPLAPPLASR